MRTWHAGAAAAVLLAGAAPGAEQPGLPVWSEGQRAAWVADSWLLTGDPKPLDGEPSVEEPIELAPPTAEESANTATPADEIPEKFWSAYFGARPREFLVDPQGLLGPVDFRERLGFLNYHAGDSSIDLYVYVFAGDQEIPGEVRAEELIERFFTAGRPAAVVYYYLGAPRRSMLYLSPSLTDAVPAAEQRRALESSVMQAVEKVDPPGQIEAFLVQMSIRIYWMERLLGGHEATEGETPVVVRAVKAAPRNPTVMEKLQPVRERAQRFVLPAAAIAGVLAAGLALSVWLARRGRYRFPDFEVEPRLGGAHAAGVGAVISFTSAAVSPASQRDQVPDYLRRA